MSNVASISPVNPKDITADDIVAALRLGVLDDDIRKVVANAKHRAKFVEGLAARSLTVGDRVALSGLSPQYLNGRTGVVTAVDRGGRGKPRVSVRLDDVSGINGKYLGFGDNSDVIHGVPAGCATADDAAVSAAA